MSWVDHVDAICMKINQRIGQIRSSEIHCRYKPVALYNTLFLPLFDYGDVVWGDKNNDTLMSGIANSTK